MGHLTIYGFETSNNMKVRVALGYKRIPFEFRTIDPGDRAEIARISGQHLTPVLVHDDRVLFDSAAILRYLDANFCDTPGLFGDSHAEQWEIEDWELFGRTRLAGPMMDIVHRRVQGIEIDDRLKTSCVTAFKSATDELRARLEGRDWLVGERMSAADITAAAVLFRIRQAEILPTGASEDALMPWVERIMSFDPGP